jgi:glycosyltransferase involved in cell wall biosynthesis
MAIDPLVSVIIPCYNVEEFVETAVQSILQQTYINLEIWLIDDASTDNTLAQLKSIHDSRVRVEVFTENTKKIGAVNAVLNKVKGSLIAFQDADDWSEPDRIKLQVEEFLKQPDLGICFTNYGFVHKIRNKIENVALTDEELKDEFLHFLYRKFIHLSPTMCATMMITKDVLESTKGYHPYFSGRVAEDIHWVYRILKRFKGIAINQPLYNIRIREGSLTQSQFAGKNSKSAYSWQLLSKIIQKDINEQVDVLAPQNINELKRLELLACEEALTESMKTSQNIREKYERSWSFKVGKIFLWPLHFFKKLNYFNSKL